MAMDIEGDVMAWSGPSKPEKTRTEITVANASIDDAMWVMVGERKIPMKSSDMVVHDSVDGVVILRGVKNDK